MSSSRSLSRRTTLNPIPDADRPHSNPDWVEVNARLQEYEINDIPQEEIKMNGASDLQNRLTGHWETYWDAHWEELMVSRDANEDEAQDDEGPVSRFSSIERQQTAKVAHEKVALARARTRSLTLFAWPGGGSPPRAAHGDCSE